MVVGSTRADAEALILECRIEVEVGTGIPVTIDIHGHCHTTARLVIVLRAAGCGVLSESEIGVEVKSTLIVGLRQSPFGVGGMGETGFQIRVTKSDGQGIGVGEGVGNEVCDGRLPALSTIARLNLMLTSEAIAEVQRGRPVDHRPRDIIVLPSFSIVHGVHLWLKIEAEIEAHLRVDDAILQAKVVILITIFSVVALGGIGRCQVDMPVVAVDTKEIAIYEGIKNACYRAVTIIEAVAIVVGELQEVACSDGFAVGESSREVATDVPRIVILDLVIDAVATCQGQNLIIIDLRVTAAVAIVLIEPSIEIQGDIAPRLL